MGAGLITVLKQWLYILPAAKGCKLRGYCLLDHDGWCSSALREGLWLR